MAVVSGQSVLLRSRLVGQHVGGSGKQAAAANCSSCAGLSCCVLLEHAGMRTHPCSLLLQQAACLSCPLQLQQQQRPQALPLRDSLRCGLLLLSWLPCTTLLTGLGVQGAVVVDIGIAQGATGHSITADADGCHRADLEGAMGDVCVNVCRQGGAWRDGPPCCRRLRGRTIAAASLLGGSPGRTTRTGRPQWPHDPGHPHTGMNSGEG